MNKSLGIKYFLEQGVSSDEEQMKRFEEIINSFIGHHVLVKIS